MPNSHSKQFWLWRGCWGALLLLLFATRLYALEHVPPGLTHDEASNGHDSAAILRGVHRLYFASGYGHEPLYNYSAALLTLGMGQSILTLRFTTIAWSLLTWALTTALARRWWGRRAALLTGAALAAAFWPLMMARVALRAPTLAATLTAAALAYDHALAYDRALAEQRPAWRQYALAGLLLGLSFYTYMASRGMPLIFLGFLGWMGVCNRPLAARAWRGTLAVMLIAALIGAPLFLYLRAHPGLEQRIGQLGGAFGALRQGDWRPLWRNLSASLPMLFWRGDPRWLYHFAERPALEPLWAAACIVGIVAALGRLRDRRNAFALLWLGCGLAPALLTTVEYNTLHAIAAMPAAFLLVGRGLDLAVRSCPPRRALQGGLALLLMGGWLLTGSEVWRTYFVGWGQNRDVRVIYHHHLVALGRSLERSDSSAPVVVSSIYPGEFHDPYTMETTLRRDDLALRWADGQRALFFPAAAARVYTHTLAPLAPALRPLLLDHATALPPLTFRADDLIPALYGYAWDASGAWQTLTVRLNRAARAASGDPPPGPQDPAAPLPVVFGGCVRLIGYRLTPAAPHPGKPLEFLTAWEVQAPVASVFPAETAAPPVTLSPELVLFTHLLAPTGELAAQADQLDAPAWQWQPGDRFAQLHTLALPTDLPAGRYALAIGVYRRHDLQRLPLETPANATRVWIPLEVTP